ncbi:hypothetical protein ACI6Q2_06185 [Chitinophagaceae bacterium LWZ2-11]
MEKFNIEQFNSNQKSGQYSYQINDTIITQWKSGNDTYYVQTLEPPLPDMFITKSIFFNIGVLQIKGKVFKKGEFQKGIWQYYDEHGKLIKEVNYDSAYKFSWDDIILLLKKKIFLGTNW